MSPSIAAVRCPDAARDRVVQYGSKRGRSASRSVLRSPHVEPDGVHDRRELRAGASGRARQYAPHAGRAGFEREEWSRHSDLNRGPAVYESVQTAGPSTRDLPAIAMRARQRNDRGIGGGAPRGRPDRATVFRRATIWGRFHRCADWNPRGWLLGSEWGSVEVVDQHGVSTSRGCLVNPLRPCRLSWRQSTWTPTARQKASSAMRRVP
jgi:hypothetical protein